MVTNLELNITRNGPPHLFSYGNAPGSKPKRQRRRIIWRDIDITAASIASQARTQFVRFSLQKILGPTANATLAVTSFTDNPTQHYQPTERVETRDQQQRDSS